MFFGLDLKLISKVQINMKRGMGLKLDVPCMAISITKPSKLEFADWLGIIGKTRRHGTFFT
jgi:hypothetical protein